MAKTTRGMLRRIATRGMIAALPVAIASAYASGLFIEPPRLAEARYQTVAEITTTPNTIGVATSPLYGQSKAEIERQLDDLLSIGVTTIRVFVPWGLVEPVDNFYNWSSIDDIMSAAAARNMGVMAQVNATPVWGGANGPGFPLGSGAPNVNAFADFMGVFANRYGTTVSAYEIWNEPNYYQFFNPISPEAYTDLLKAVYPILKAVDPTATIVAGAVGTTQTFGGLTMSPVEFVQRMLAAGAADFFDALSVHPYGDQIPYTGSCPSCPSNILTPRQQVEAIMGMLSGKKVWITEYGVATGPGGFTEAQQAAWIKDLLDHWQTYDPALVGPIFLYTIRDALNPQDPGNLENFYGLWNALGGEKASADMLRDWIAAHPVVPGPEVPPPTTGTPANPLAQIVAAIQQVVQAVIQTITNFVNAVATTIQSVVQAIVNLFAVVRPLAPAGTLSVTDVEGPAAAMRSASLVSGQEVTGAADAVDGGALVDGGAVEGVEAAADKTAAVDSAAVELAVEPVAETVVEPVAEPEVAPAETPPVVEATVPEPVAEATPAAADTDADTEGKASTDSSSASAAKPATQSAKSTKSDAGDETSHKSGVSTSRMTPKSESVSATKSESKSETSSADNDKPKTVSATAGASSSSDSSSAGSSNSSSSGADD